MQNNDKEWVRSYAAAWDSSIRVYINVRFFPPFSISFQEMIFFILIEGLMLFLDQVLGISFALLIHYGVIPGLAVYFLRKLKLEGKYLHHWLLSVVRFVFSDKHVSGNLEPVELDKEKLRLLSRKAS
ncbi:TcpE family conjugal transfer membrane protein [Thermoactinomyces sp. CICC 10521]|uniref:TcpE family conjugal transfer membrane protein n=1 Tax=Thermoactinomyces sp. CICC 10521 TaxID=2767426 RepID=UPI0018DC4270|nr:hypothetical protein [Thermoactinomyces sp. CICC 10521]